MSKIPRRNRTDLMMPAELAIRDAALAVEKHGAHPLLTDAIVLLAEAQAKVADFVDKVPRVEPIPDRVLPNRMTPAIREVLGMSCFECAPLARAFQAAGEDIARRTEDEQAFVLFWLLPFAIEHGPHWREAAGEQLLRMKEQFEARDSAATSDKLSSRK